MNDRTEEMQEMLHLAESYLGTLALALREGAVRGLAPEWPRDLTELVDKIRALLARVD